MKAKKIIQNKYVKTIIKLSVSTICIIVLLQKIDFTDIATCIKKANLFYLLIATFFFTLSKILSSVRLHRYLLAMKIPIDANHNLKLYWLGMFYNLFLPGGIGGDGYKIFYLRKQFYEIPSQRIIQALLKDRLNGLFVFFLLLIVITYAIDIPLLETMSWVLWISFLVVASILIALERLLVRAEVIDIVTTSFYSLLVQLSQLVSAFFIVLALGVTEYIPQIIFTFQISTIIAMLPISVGGVGLRELTFIYFSKTFHYNQELAVSIAVLFFVISTLISLIGIYFHFRPEKMRYA